MATEHSVDELIEYCKALAAKAREGARFRRRSAASWLDPDEAAHEAGRILAQGLSGRKLPKLTAEERSVNAHRDETIALRMLADAEKLDAIVLLIQAQAHGITIPAPHMTALYRCGTCGAEYDPKTTVDAFNRKDVYGEVGSLWCAKCRPFETRGPFTNVGLMERVTNGEASSRNA
jgi:hypothetical protein